MNRFNPEGASPDSVSNIGKNQLLALAIPFAVCCCLLLTSTVSLFPELPLYDTKRIAQFFLLTFACFTALSHSGFRTSIATQAARIPGLIGIGITLLFVLGFTSAFVNSGSLRSLVYSLVDVSLLGLLCVLTLIIAASREIAGQHFDRVVISFLALFALAVGAQEIAGYFASKSAGMAYNFDVALIHFGFPRIYNQLQTWTIPVLAALPYIFPRHRLAAIICVMALGLNWYILLATGARGSVVALLAAFSVALIISPVARKAILKWHSAGILLGVLLYAALLLGAEAGQERAPANPAKATISTQEIQNSDSGKEKTGPARPLQSSSFFERSIGRPLLHTTGRTRLWQAALRDGFEHPLLGIGPMNFACKGPQLRAGSPHNLALQIFSEWGIPAATILAFLGVSLLWLLFKNLKRPPEDRNRMSQLHAMLSVTLLAALIHLMVSSLLIAPMSQVTAALIGGWLMGAIPVGRLGARMKSMAALLSTAALSSLLLLPFAYHETVRMPSYELQLPVGEEGRPRLWQLSKACSDKVR